MYPMNVTKPIGAEQLENLNQKKGVVLNSDNVDILNTSYYKKTGNTNTATQTASTPNPAAAGSATVNHNTGQAQSTVQNADVRRIALPALSKRVSKGQKVPLTFSSNKIKVNFGWNVNNSACDVDVSAFLLAGNGKVVGDDFFVFYGQESSPERSVLFKNVEEANVLQIFDIDTSILNPAVQKIVFVMTINDAIEKALNFGMLKDAYIQIVDPVTNAEVASFLVEEYYNNINSMMMGEVYLHNGAWKFNAIGNGVNKDLAGLCEFYGVQVE